MSKAREFYEKCFRIKLSLGMEVLHLNGNVEDNSIDNLVAVPYGLALDWNSLEQECGFNLNKTLGQIIESNKRFVARGVKPNLNCLSKINNTIKKVSLWVNFKENRYFGVPDRNNISSRSIDGYKPTYD